MVNFGNSETTTRVVVLENQAKIPSLMERNKPSEPTYGLPIPVTWVRNNRPKTSSEKESNDQSKDDLIPLPGLTIENWSAIERDSFHLGLYLFAKNFRLVKRFMDNKRMKSIINYYYRGFHKSGDHEKWAKWRKDRTKRPHYARKLFTGWSHRELITRLSSSVTDECRDHLIKEGTKYIEGRLSLTRFVFTLKHYVGMNLLVEAVAIGHEERDLLKFRQISDWSNVSIELPIVNTSSSLTPQEILKILKGNSRLSKSRSSDLFWDAVWPRLLARGWHSVQPRNNVPQNPKNLVFMIPGVTEFSRNELKKGIHYFDSLADVLSKVASDPELIELGSDHRNELVEPHTNRASSNEEHREKSIEERYSKSEFEQETVMNPNLSRMALDSDSNPSTNQLEFSNPGAIVLHQPVSVPQRYSTRSRLLSAKALENIAFGYLSPKKKRKREDNENPSTRVRVPVSSGGSGNVENAMDGSFSGGSMARMTHDVIPYQYF